MRIILIQNYASSGTTLLHSLFDSHPQLLTLPSLYGIMFYREYEAFCENCFTEQMLGDQIIKFSLNSFRGLFELGNVNNKGWGLTTLGHSQNENCCVLASDFAEKFFVNFNNSLSKIKSDNSGHSLSLDEWKKAMRPAVLISAYKSYAQCLGWNVSNIRALVFPFHSNPSRTIDCILEDFSDVKVVHVVRDPVSAFDSALNHYWHSIFLSPGLCALSPIYCGISQILKDRALHIGATDALKSISPLHSKLKNQSCAIRLEDLRAEPEREMRQVADWCDIDWHPTLLETTCGGKVWWNRPGSKRVAGLDKTMSLFFKNTSGFDRWRLACLSKPLRRHFKYADKNKWSIALDSIEEIIGLIACLLSMRFERENQDSFRSYILFLRNFLKRWPNLQEFLMHRFSKWINARASIVSHTTHVLSEQDKSQLIALSESVRNDCGHFEWFIAIFLGRIIGYYEDRRCIVDGYRYIRKNKEWVILLRDIKAQ